MTSVLEEFRLQSRFCCEFGSPFMKDLLAAAADDIEAGGITEELTQSWHGSPRADAVSLRLAGALQAAVLTGRDPKLAAEYPARRPDDWSIERIWPLARDFLIQDGAWVRDF